MEEGERSGANYGRYDGAAMCCNNVLCGVDHGVLELSIKEGRNLKAMDRNGIHCLMHNTAIWCITYTVICCQSYYKVVATLSQSRLWQCGYSLVTMLVKTLVYFCISRDTQIHM